MGIDILYRQKNKKIFQTDHRPPYLDGILKIVEEIHQKDKHQPNLIENASLEIPFPYILLLKYRNRLLGFIAFKVKKIDATLMHYFNLFQLKLSVKIYNDILIQNFIKDQKILQEHFNIDRLLKIKREPIDRLETPYLHFSSIASHVFIEQISSQEAFVFIGLTMFQREIFRSYLLGLFFVYKDLKIRKDRFAFLLENFRESGILDDHNTVLWFSIKDDRLIIRYRGSDLSIHRDGVKSVLRFQGKKQYPLDQKPMKIFSKQQLVLLVRIVK